MDPQDLQICLGHGGIEDNADGAMAPPIVQTSLFAQPTFRQLLAGLDREHAHRVYTRGRNPTVEAVERKLAALERGEAAQCFASGMAAISAVLFGLLRQGDHLLFVNHVYGPALELAQRLESFGVDHDQVLSADPETVAAALRPETRLLYLESPGTMAFHMLDVPSLVDLARERGLLTVMDNTWSTPLFQKPLTRGVDLVVHSCTKYLGGHSDLVAGAVVGSAGLIERLFYDAFLLLGGTLSPFDAWLLHRGLRTLPARMAQHRDNALAVARFLQVHPKVRRVFHPLLHPDDRALAADQLSGTSGLFSFELASDDFDTLCAFIDRLRFFRIGVSWGGAESLVISPHNGTNGEALRAAGLPPSLVRLSVGLEGAALLIDDLEQAFAGVGAP